MIRNSCCRLCVTRSFSPRASLAHYTRLPNVPHKVEKICQGAWSPCNDHILHHTLVVKILHHILVVKIIHHKLLVKVLHYILLVKILQHPHVMKIHKKRPCTSRKTDLCDQNIMRLCLAGVRKKQVVGAHLMHSIAT